MDQILIACGDVELLRKIVGDLPPNRFKPIATKSGAGVADKVAKRHVPLAVVHEELADGHGAALCNELKSLSNPPLVLYLSSDKPPAGGPFDGSMRYPVPGPVFRGALTRLFASRNAEEDLGKWEAFYNEVQAARDRLPSANYYQMLGLSSGAPHHSIVKVYDYLSRRYHPDRYAQHRGKPWGDAIYESTNDLFKDLTEAFSVLTDRRLRKKYDQALSEGQIRLAPEDTSVQDSGPQTLDALASNSKSRKFLRLAQADIARADWAAALQNLKFAASMEDIPAVEEKIAEIEAKLKGS